MGLTTLGARLQRVGKAVSGGNTATENTDQTCLHSKAGGEPSRCTLHIQTCNGIHPHLPTSSCMRLAAFPVLKSITTTCNPGL